MADAFLFQGFEGGTVVECRESSSPFGFMIEYARGTIRSVEIEDQFSVNVKSDTIGEFGTYMPDAVGFEHNGVIYIGTHSALFAVAPKGVEIPKLDEFPGRYADVHDLFRPLNLIESLVKLEILHQG